jgi:hypothetical protein
LFYMYHTKKNEDSSTVADSATAKCLSFLEPFLKRLDKLLDLRLVRTLANTVTSIVRHHQCSTALLLSELGAYLIDPEHAPAGTKRLANLIHNPRWQAQDIDHYLLEASRQRVEQDLQQSQRKHVLCILDESEMEKPESSQWEGLAPVISSKARRLSRPRPKMGSGYYRGPPGGPIVVPGLDWRGVLLTRWGPVYERYPLTLGAWDWDSKTHQKDRSDSGEGPYQNKAEARAKSLHRVVEVCGVDRLLHIWDRGMANEPWLGQALDQGWHFVVRWKKGNKLRPAAAPSIGNPEASNTAREKDGVVAWRLTIKKRPWGQRRIVNPRNPKQFVNVYYGAVPVSLLHRDEPLWLVWARIGKESKLRRGVKEPWRLLTSEAVTTEEECWQIVEAYAGRWQIEQMLRYGKSELGIESIRVKDWESRNKLLAIVGLTYAFLIDLLGDSTGSLLNQVLAWAHRTGRQANSAWRPLYRLRLALSALWQRYTPNFQGFP